MANENNIVKLEGIMTMEPELSHRVYGEGFYKTLISVPRLSDSVDLIPVTVSERLLAGDFASVGEKYYIEGEYRSYNNYSDEGSKLKLTVFAKSFSPVYPEDDNEPNDIFLDGYLCKEPTYRQTPFGREIADMLLAVNRAYGKSDYIPLIAWSRNARFCSTLPVGTHLKVYGRIQSRQYQKKIDDDIITKTAYEVSVSKLEITD